MRWVALAALVACSGAPAPSAPRPVAPSFTAQPGDLVIAHATVVAMTGDAALADHTVVVRGDRIVAVAPSAQVAVAGAQLIDGTGHWVMPGLTDMHVHLAERELGLYVAAGVTTVRNMFGDPKHLVWRDQAARGERLAPTIVSAGPIVDGDPPAWPGSAVLTDPAAAEALVAAQHAAGYDFIKVYSRLGRPAYDAVVAAAARHGMAVAGHVPDDVGLLGVLAAHQKSIEHLDGYQIALVRDGGTIPQDPRRHMHDVIAQGDPAKLAALVGKTVAAGTWNCPTLVAADRYAALGDPDALERRVAWLGVVRPADLRSWTADGWPPGVIAAAGEEYAGAFRVVAALAAANAPLLLGTDTGNPFVIPGASAHEEIELMVRAGIPRPRVMKIATAEAARFLGTPRELGVIAPGARADLLLLASDPMTAPLADVPDGVMLRGRWLPRAQLEGLLAELASASHAPRDRWRGVAPLVADASAVQTGAFDVLRGDDPIGEERYVIARNQGARSVTSQLVIDVPERAEASFSVGPTRLTANLKVEAARLALTATITGGALVISGTDLMNKPLHRRVVIPRGAFLAAPFGGGAALLADKLDQLPIGGHRTLTSVGLDSAALPAVVIAISTHQVERLADASSGHRAYRIATTTGGVTTTGALTLDDHGAVIDLTLGAPLNMRFVPHGR